ncbi:hypothetical protein Hdeb2414_s0008g00276241 [Helianthus debilis subsp. tardiflorus]
MTLCNHFGMHFLAEIKFDAARPQPGALPLGPRQGLPPLGPHFSQGRCPRTPVSIERYVRTYELCMNVCKYEVMYERYAPMKLHSNVCTYEVMHD